MKQLPLVIILSSGHSGSKLLTRILHNNGIFMSRYRGKNGEDCRVMGNLIGDKNFRKELIKNKLDGPHPDINYYFDQYFRNFQHCIIKPAFFYYARNMLNRRWGFDTVIRKKPKPLNGYGFKIATNFPMVADEFIAYLNTIGIEENTYFIYLSRNLGDWFQSGYTSNSKGVPRPTQLPYLNYFLDDYIKYLWFNNPDPEISLQQGTKLNLLTINDQEFQRYKPYLESLLWAFTQKRSMEVQDKATNFLHIKYEDLLKAPRETENKVSDFLNINIKLNINSLESSKINFSKLPEETSNLAIETNKFIGYP